MALDTLLMRTDSRKRENGRMERGKDGNKISFFNFIKDLKLLRNLLII